MSTSEIIESYKDKFCSKCKNACKEINICNITIHKDNKTKEAKCDSYEKKK